MYPSGNNLERGTEEESFPKQSREALRIQKLPEDDKNPD